MMLRPGWLGVAALLAAAAVAPALAQTRIGAATTIERDVSGLLSGRARALAGGDNVFASETIRTANASAARLRFLDDTQLSIGPSASLVLDRFVFNPDGNARDATVRLTQGAMRWISGASAPRSYGVRTPHAVIGVRGTTFDVLVEGDRTVVTLVDGSITVCAIANPRSCAALALPGQTVSVARARIEGVRPDGPAPRDFADRCLRPIDRAACVLGPGAPVLVATPDAPTRGWTGFYGGVHGGFVTRRGDVTVGGGRSVQASIAAGNVPAGLAGGGDGGLFGAQAGFNWQASGLLFGVEADIAHSGARGGRRVAVNPFGVLVTTETTQRLAWLGTARGRIGVVAGDVLFFATGGLAYGGVEQSGSIIPIPGNNPTYRATRTAPALGWALGGGVEYAIMPGVSLKLDYLHYDLGARTLTLRETTGILPGDIATMRAATRGDSVRAGFNVRF